MIKALSLFSSAGIGELLLDKDRINIDVANELIPKRAEVYKFFYPTCNCIVGDVRKESIKEQIISKLDKNHKLLIATPPCQGLSTLGKNKIQSHYENDKRNFLVFEIFEIMNNHDFDYILIENVPRFLEMYFPFDSGFFKLIDLINIQYSHLYNIEAAVLNAKDFGTPQSRPRAFIKIFKKHLSWPWPRPQAEITLEEAIGHLPSLEPGEYSNIKWHYAKQLNPRIIEALRHTAPGKSAISNEIYFPKKENGERIKGFHNTYKRMVWNEPSPARTTYCGSVSSHNNVHPGRSLGNGRYSDARALTLLETFLVSSIPSDIVFPEGISDTFIRTLIGEAVPPKLLSSIVKEVNGGR